jgi:sialate O-acetylesterase
MNRFSKACLLCCSSIFLSFFAFADIRLPQLISNAMVLQRDVPLKIWGWADAAEKITVDWNGKKYSATTGADGKWLVNLPAIKTGGPYTMTLSGKNTITINDILIGDVWFCSGQSNMVVPMERVKEKYPEEIPNANYPQIRNFFIPTLSDVRAVHEDLPASKWVVTSPATVGTMGAGTFFFAKELYRKYKVPIGIINSSVGGTPAEAWASADAFAGFEPYASRLEKFKDSATFKPAPRPGLGAQTVRRTPQPDKGTAGPIPWYDVTYQPKNWHKFWMPGYWDDQGTKNLHGVIWFRKEVDVPASMTGHPAKLFLGRIIDADEAYVNGVKVGNITYQYPPRRYDVPATLLKPGKNIIVVRVTNTSDKGGFVPDKNYSLTDGKERIDLRGEWTYQVGQVQYPNSFGGGGGFGGGINAQNEPSGLYNTMVAPAINYAIKGFLWYQGEANSGRAADYGRILTALINDWRSKWNMGSLPFIYAQLPNFMEVVYYPAESQWAELREQQLQTLSVPNTAMTVGIELGEWNDIHPLNKKDVGERMALAAEKLAYGENNVYMGPIYQSAVVNGDKIIVSFSNTGGGLISNDGEPLSQFAIAGADKRFVWANARIEGNTVVVWNDDIKEPMYVRYAWADNPEGANLYNKEGLPASPFRTDKPQPKQ